MFRNITDLKESTESVLVAGSINTQKFTRITKMLIYNEFITKAFCTLVYSFVLLYSNLFCTLVVVRKQITLVIGKNFKYAK